MAKIAIVEDDHDIAEIETFALKNSNYEVESYENAADFYASLKKEVPDLVLLDVMLPDEDGYTITKKLRERPQTAKIPIIMVTAKSSEIDMLRGLDGGADDYMKKPFSVMELISRVRALLRRAEPESADILKIGGITMDRKRHTVMAGDRQVELTLKEYELLKLLMLNEGTVLTRDVIMQKVWDTDFEGETRTVDVHIKTLRQKLGPMSECIRTVRSVGYVME
ncbi:MAG: response regulator transcription factor [Lachnospiraceae bacterium]|nr:response regulator transcription factor [Lachnospiraceae bacterium]